MDNLYNRVPPVVEDAATPHHRVDGENPQTVEQQFLEHFGLTVQPFGVTPNPRFLYLGDTHRQALAALTYGTELNRGFLTLIGKPGMGKTSLLFHYLDSLRNSARTVFLFQTVGNARDLMYYLLADLGLDGAGKDLPEMHSILNRVLMEEMHSGRRLVLVIDEAQNLDEKVLESVRLLSNFETPWMKLIQIVLAGQPQLAEQLAKSSMAQLRQRISFSIPIKPLTREEVDAYVDHRLWVAGYNGPPMLSIGARALLAERSEGVPRNINNMCFCAMSLGWASKAKTIDREMMRDVVADLEPGSPNEETQRPPKLAVEPKPIIPVAARPPALTVTEPPSRGWLAKAAVASVVLLVLFWSGVHFNLQQRLVFFLHEIKTAVKSSVVSTSTPVLPVPATPTSPNNSPLVLSSKATLDDQNPNVSLRVGAESLRSNQGPN
jgi:type II secretory pathway predicted ATPase ExeA